MEATNLTVIVENEEQVELSFTRTWNASFQGKLPPLNIDKRFFYFQPTLSLLLGFRFGSNIKLINYMTVI